jgi:hypothetical protein
MGLKYVESSSFSSRPTANTTHQSKMASAPIKPPTLEEALGPLLPALPAAALSSKPAENILALLSPVLKQRVQFLSDSSSDPWVRLLCYDAAKAARLQEIAQSDRLELHPVSGEVEIDWDYDAQIQYRRADEETLQALVAVESMELAFQLIYCTGEADGWRVGEVGPTDKPSPFSNFGGVSTITEAERQFNESQSNKSKPSAGAPVTVQSTAPVQADDDDDDDYWARYDATPARTPAAKRSPAPATTRTQPTATEDSDYYAQYDDVQPAMDNHDPDEEVDVEVSPPLGLKRASDSSTAGHASGGGEMEGIMETQGSWTLAEAPRATDEPDLLLHPHPRPGSSASSGASIEKLEAAAERKGQSEFAVKQHISRTVKSLFLLSRSAGIDRDEFERIVKTEIDVLGLMGD